jgi:two-component system, cell cycle sensor histidine kinase and response regulator CckA
MTLDSNGCCIWPLEKEIKMKTPLRILHLEDDPTDAALIQSTLKVGGITCETTRVQTHDDFVAALDGVGIDLILSDFTLPAFDGLSALKIAQTIHPDLPVIFVSGTLGEQRAINSLRSGAADYVLKGDLTHLVPAVRHAMQEVEERAERRRLEAQAIEGQKMDVIGQLAGGVAHDFNNILSVIIGYCHLLRSDLVPDSPQLEYAEEIRHASERAAGLTRQLLVFSRKQTVQPVVLDLNDVLQEIEQLLRRLIDANIEMTLVFGNPIGRVHADSGYVGQVLMNLVVNARDAMPYGGKLTISTADVTVDEKCADAHMVAFPGEYVMISVADTGTGMTDEVKARLFEPLFTTKPSGKGTGLGLVTCQNIIHLSGGHISVYSESGKGTTFNVYFPRQHAPIDTPAQSACPETLPRGTETVLVVEDDPTVRHLACAILEAHGYKVLEANNGEEGARTVREFKGPPIRLVITDVIMPLMGGKALAEVLKITNPDIKILFTSGYPDEAITHYGALDAGVAFLPKPYTPVTLARKVRKMLDASRTATRKLVPMRSELTGVGPHTSA